MLGYLLLVLSAVALIVTLSRAWRTRQFLSRAVRAPGTVTRITVTSEEVPAYGDNSAVTTRYFTPHVEFARQDGTLTEFESSVADIKTPGFSVGEVETVVYEPGDPWATAQIDDLGVWRRTLLSGLATVLLLLSSIVVFWNAD